MLWIIERVQFGPFEESLLMHEDKRHKSPNVMRVGCLLTFVLVLASVFLGGVIVSINAIGVVGKANASTKSPVGAWTLPNGTVQQYRADGTGSATTRDGKVTYFEWRLKGDKLALHFSGNPNSSARRRIALAGNRVLRGIGLMSERGSANYVVVEVTPEELTVAIDDERMGPPPTWERGDQFECTAAAMDQTEVRTTSDEEAE